MIIGDGPNRQKAGRRIEQPLFDTARWLGCSRRYDDRLRKRRITLNPDEDVVEALEAVGGRSVSAVANDALRQAVAADAHRAALLRWLGTLDEEHGPPTQADLAAAGDLLDQALSDRGGGESAA